MLNLFRNGAVGFIGWLDLLWQHDDISCRFRTGSICGARHRTESSRVRAVQLRHGLLGRTANLPNG